MGASNKCPIRIDHITEYKKTDYRCVYIRIYICIYHHMSYSI